VLSSRAWAAYGSAYRTKEVKSLADWILAGESGSVLGLKGTGKSNLLGFLCRRPEVLKSYLPDAGLKLAVVQVDMNSLPGNDQAIFYRVILRSLSEARPQIAALDPPDIAGDDSIAVAIETHYRQVAEKTDPFLSQSALREVLLLFEEKGARLVLVMDPFDQFCRTATPQILDNLRGLRDSFKSTLSYIVSLRHELAYLRDPQEIGEIYELLDMHLCWVGAMGDEDARSIISQTAETTSRSFTKTEIERLIELTGSYPSLLRAAGLWLAMTSPVPEEKDWLVALLAERSLQYRLEEIWNGLTQEEQLVLSELQKWQSLAATRNAKRSDGQGRSADGDKAIQGFVQQHGDILARLTAKGLCCQTPTGTGWHIRSELLAAYIANVEGRGNGKIWLDETTGELYQGQTPLEDLAPLERAVLHFLIGHARNRITKSQLIENAWPDDVSQEGVTDAALYQVIMGLRKKIEPNRVKPCYLVNWRGQPEGGYQFFPEGQPG